MSSRREMLQQCRCSTIAMASIRYVSYYCLLQLTCLLAAFFDLLLLYPVLIRVKRSRYYLFVSVLSDWCVIVLTSGSFHVIACLAWLSCIRILATALNSSIHVVVGRNQDYWLRRLHLSPYVFQSWQHFTMTFLEGFDRSLHQDLCSFIYLARTTRGRWQTQAFLPQERA